MGNRVSPLPLSHEILLGYKQSLEEKRTMITLGPLSCPVRHPFADAQGSAQPLPDMRPTRQDRERTAGVFTGETSFLITSYWDPTNFIEQKGLVGIAGWTLFLA